METLRMRECLLDVSKLVFDWGIVESSPDIDVLLQRLFVILLNYPELHLESRGAVLLLNPRGRYLQVAQYGIAPSWQAEFEWDIEPFTTAEIGNAVKVVRTEIDFDGDGNTSPHQLILLPLHADKKGIGYAVLFAQPGQEPDRMTFDFMEGLSNALSGLIHRTLANETLRIRELELEEARSDAIRRLGVASEYRDNETGWHIMRMTNIALATAKKMGLSEQMRELLFVAAPMHDVGKIGIPDDILLKPGKLSQEEFDVMKTHTEIGSNILDGEDTLIAAAREIAHAHHERWDGNGYPLGLSGEAIPVFARICAIADVFDALTSKRHYKEAWSVESSVDWVISESGKHFDPAVVEAFKQAMPDILRIRELYRDEIIDPKKVLSLPPVERRPREWVTWDASFSVGIDIIDAHHHYLFDLINDLYDVVVEKRGAREVARLIKALDAYAKVHFRAEEKMMAHYGFAGLGRQQHQHHAFEEKIKEFYEELHANPLVAQFDVLTYLRSWLVHHILAEDAQLRPLGLDSH